MVRVVVAVDPGTGVSAAGFAAAWNAEFGSQQGGPAGVEAAGEQVLLPGLVELVVLPVAVNLLSSALYDLIKRVLARAGKKTEVSEVEVVEFTSAGGDRMVVARSRREVS